MGKEELEMLMRLGVIKDEQAGLDKQLSRAQALRDTSMLQGGTHAGGVYVADSPLLGVADLVRKYRSGKKSQGIEKQQEELRAEQVKARSMYAGMMDSPTPNGQMPPNSMPGVQGQQQVNPQSQYMQDWYEKQRQMRKYQGA
jgi:hypothetical protein